MVREPGNRFYGIEIQRIKGEDGHYTEMLDDYPTLAEARAAAQGQLARLPAPELRDGVWEYWIASIWGGFCHGADGNELPSARRDEVDEDKVHQAFVDRVEVLEQPRPVQG